MADKHNARATEFARVVRAGNYRDYGHGLTDEQADRAIVLIAECIGLRYGMTPYALACAVLTSLGEVGVRLTFPETKTGVVADG